MWIELSQISPAARTSACSVCGSNVKNVPALTSGVHVEFEGNIEICKRCIIEAAMLYGMVPAEKHAELEADYNELRLWANSAYTEIQVKDEQYATLSTALGRVVAERDALKDNAESLAASHRVGG